MITPRPSNSDKKDITSLNGLLIDITELIIQVTEH